MLNFSRPTSHVPYPTSQFPLFTPLVLPRTRLPTPQFPILTSFSPTPQLPLPTPHSPLPTPHSPLPTPFSPTPQLPLPTSRFQLLSSFLPPFICYISKCFTISTMKKEQSKTRNNKSAHYTLSRTSSLCQKLFTELRNVKYIKFIYI